MKALIVSYGIMCLALCECRAIVSPSSYGAAGDGVADDTVALQSACNAALATNDSVELASAVYRISSPVIANCDISGQSEQRSVIRLANPRANGLVVTTQGAVHWEKFRIDSIAQQAGGSAILVAPPVGINRESTFERLMLVHVYSGFSFVSAAWWRMFGCSVEAYSSVGVEVGDDVNPDAGDSSITNCLFNSGGTAIYQRSSGGLKVTACKIITAAYGYYLDLSPGAITGDLLLTANSIEGVSQAIVLKNEPGSLFYNVTITGNQINAKLVGIDCQASQGYVWLTNMTVTGNTIYLGAPNCIGIDINGATTVSIIGNTIVPGSSNNYSVVLGPLCQWSRVAQNPVEGFAPIVNQGAENTIQ
jgi:hypothetical protein